MTWRDAQPPIDWPDDHFREQLRRHFRDSDYDLVVESVCEKFGPDRAYQALYEGIGRWDEAIPNEVADAYINTLNRTDIRWMCREIRDSRENPTQVVDGDTLDVMVAYCEEAAGSTGRRAVGTYWPFDMRENYRIQKALSHELDFVKRVLNRPPERRVREYVQMYGGERIYHAVYDFFAPLGVTSFYDDTREQSFQPLHTAVQSLGIDGTAIVLSDEHQRLTNSGTIDGDTEGDIEFHLRKAEGGTSYSFEARDAHRRDEGRDPHPNLTREEWVEKMWDHNAETTVKAYCDRYGPETLYKLLYGADDPDAMMPDTMQEYEEASPFFNVTAGYSLEDITRWIWQWDRQHRDPPNEVAGDTEDVATWLITLNGKPDGDRYPFSARHRHFRSTADESFLERSPMGAAAPVSDSFISGLHDSRKRPYSVVKAVARYVGPYDAFHGAEGLLAAGMTDHIDWNLCRPYKDALNSQTADDTVAAIIEATGARKIDGMNRNELANVLRAAKGGRVTVSDPPPYVQGWRLVRDDPKWIQWEGSEHYSGAGPRVYMEINRVQGGTWVVVARRRVDKDAQMDDSRDLHMSLSTREDAIGMAVDEMVQNPQGVTDGGVDAESGGVAP